MEIRNHLLKEGGQVKPFTRSPNHSGEFKAGNLDTIVIHYTAGPTAQSAINTLVSPRVQASAHVVIDYDGSITQLVPFNLVAWHAGPSKHLTRTGMNQHSIGIEIVNEGPLTKSGNVFRGQYGTTYNPSDAFYGTHRNQTQPKYWHAYKEAQIQATEELCASLIEKYSIKYIVGHEEITSFKQDPGPAFPLDTFRNRLLGTGRAEDGPDQTSQEMRVGVSFLNIRSGPSSTNPKVAEALEKGTKVRVLETRNGWAKVETTIQGWVSAEFLTQS